MANKFSKACLAKAQHYVDKKGEGWTCGISAGGFITPKGTEAGSLFGGSACHSFMLRYRGHEKEPFIFVNIMKKSKMLQADVKSGACEAFVRFMCQTGPFRNYIINRDKIDELMNGGVMIDALAAGMTVTLFIAKTLRILYEDKYRVKIWKDLVDRGVHPMLALNAAMSVHDDLRLMNGQTHNSTMVPCKKDDIKNLFVDHLPILTEWDGDGGRECTARLFAPGATDKSGYSLGYCSWPAEHLIPITAEGGRAVKVPDGWGGYTTKTVGGTIDDIAKDLVELQEKYA